MLLLLSPSPSLSDEKYWELPPDEHVEVEFFKGSSGCMGGKVLGGCNVFRNIFNIGISFNLLLSECCFCCSSFFCCSAFVLQSATFTWWRGLFICCIGMKKDMFIYLSILQKNINVNYYRVSTMKLPVSVGLKNLLSHCTYRKSRLLLSCSSTWG